jgi:hypothetical protein
MYDWCEIGFSLGKPRRDSRHIRPRVVRLPRGDGILRADGKAVDTLTQPAMVFYCTVSIETGNSYIITEGLHSSGD